VAEVNRELAKLNDGQHVFFLDIGGRCLDAEGNIPRDIMPDRLHPSLKGYEAWADAIRAPLQQLLK
jgi:lysophospholipase L1-like esterase